MNTGLGPTGTWQTVMHTAGHCCQCTGACGSTHARTGGRCTTEDSHYTSKRRGPVRLLAAPADPAQLALPPHQAARLPATALAAWCPACHHGALTAAQHTARTTAQAAIEAATGALF